jgi:hypothetical protein
MRTDSPSGAVGKPAASGGQSLPDSNNMKQTITEYQFVDSFRHAGRESQFTVPARRALFEYLERFEEDTDTDIELDPVGICCEWAEYPCALKAANDFGFKGNELDTEESALDWLHERTQVVEFDGGVVIQQF